MIDEVEIVTSVYIIAATVVWLLFLFALVCIFRAVPEHEVRREEGTDDVRPTPNGL